MVKSGKNSHPGVKLAVVSGGLRRLGKAISQYFTSQGYIVVALHSHAPEGKLALDKLKKINDALYSYAVDFKIAQESDFHELMTAMQKEFQTLPEVLVHNASLFSRESFLTATPAHIRELWQINLEAALLLTRQWHGTRNTKEKSAVIFIGDCQKNIDNENFFYYSITKAAVLQAMKLLAKSLAPACRVNAISPGTVLAFDDADQAWLQQAQDNSLLKEIGTPHNIISAIDFILNNDFVCGANITVDGGRNLT